MPMIPLGKHAASMALLKISCAQVKNYFYLGNYQMAITEATQGDFGESCKTELNCLVYRAYIGMNNFQVHFEQLFRADQGS